MRHVKFDHKKLKLPTNWANEVAKFETQISAETDADKRIKLINKYSGYWSALKLELSKLSNFKCWYSEAPQEGTDVDVDHYRPKGRVNELSKLTIPHPGYWWLAFKPENYRYASIVTNRRRCDVQTGETGGKADYFPIADESKRAWKSTDPHKEEVPLLLDPCDDHDVKLLTFKEDGEAMPRYNQADHPMLYTRADTSINLYHLNHSDFVRGRLELRDQIYKQVEDAIYYFSFLEEEHPAIDRAYSNVISNLVALTKPGRAYSSFCVAILEKYRAEVALAPIFPLQLINS